MFRPLKCREYKQVLLFTMISKQPDKNKRLILITQTQCFSKVNKNMLLGSFPKTHIDGNKMLHTLAGRVVGGAGAGKPNCK